MWPEIYRNLTSTTAIGGAVSVKCVSEKERFGRERERIWCLVWLLLFWLWKNGEKMPFLSTPTLGVGLETAYLILIYLWRERAWG